MKDFPDAAMNMPMNIHSYIHMRVPMSIHSNIPMNIHSFMSDGALKQPFGPMVCTRCMVILPYACTQTRPGALFYVYFDTITLKTPNLREYIIYYTTREGIILDMSAGDGIKGC